jgi:DNA-binding NarL/FixJ family response regulator
MSIPRRPRRRILTVDDHQLLREGIAAVLENREDATPLPGQQRSRSRQELSAPSGRHADGSAHADERPGAITEIRGEFPDARIIVPDHLCQRRAGGSPR